MNRNLKCNATNCAFNKRMDCRAGAINIRGEEAAEIAETSCSSYVDRSSNAFTNSIDYARTTPDNIICEAQHCKYNENKNCTAEDVRIDAYKAACDTFNYK